MCGRCTSVCPAHATGKPLDPREIVLKSGEVMARSGDPVVSPPIGVDPEITVSASSLVRAHHARGGVGLHLLQGLRRDLSGQHRDPRQDPRHAPLPVAHGVELPNRAGQRLPLDGELGEPVGHEPERPRVLDEQGRGSADRRARRLLRPRVPLLGWLRRLVRRQEPEGHHRHGQAAPAGRARLRHPRPRRRAARATPPAAPATSTSSRCWPCRTSSRSTAWA